MKKMFLGIATLVVLSFCANAAWAQSDSADHAYDRVVGSPAVEYVAVAEAPSFFAQVTRPFWRAVGWLMKFTATDAWAQVGSSDKEYERVAVVSSPTFGPLAMTPFVVASASAWRWLSGWLGLRADKVLAY